MYADKQASYGMIGNAAMQPPWAQPAAAQTLGVPETRPSREVPEQTERLEKAVGYAEDSLRELIARLEYVLRPNGPEPATVGANGVAPGPSTAHGGHLFHIGSRVGRIGEQVQEVLRRLEI